MAGDDRVTSPALVVRRLKEFAGHHANLEITPDIHWIFLRSLSHKGLPAFRRHCGKWKCDAADDDDLLARTRRLIPLICDGELPLIKITNRGNVFSDERLIVVYCFPQEATPEKTGEILDRMFSGRFYWGSNWFSCPPEWSKT